MKPEGRICIEQIAVENLGPLRGRSFELGPFNLIFGHNETGKTFLVEFLLRALFRQADEWGLRGELGQGKVRVGGLGPEPVEFAPGDKRKLEDFWEESGAGLPVSMGRLLVVKGAELEFNRRGVDRAVLKAVLSNENLIDRIQKKISKTITKATIQGGAILGDDRGELRERDETWNDLQRMDRLLEQVDGGMSASNIRSLELELAGVRGALDDQHAAKRHQAYLLNQAWTDAQAALEGIPQEQLERLGNLLRDVRQKEGDILSAEQDLARYRKDARHYAWIEQALAVWQAQPEAPDTRVPRAALIGAGVAIALAAFLALLEQSVAAAIAALAGLGLGGLAFWLQNRAASQPAEQADRSSLAEGFEERFQEPLTDLAQLKAVEAKLRKAATLAEETENRQTRVRAERTAKAADFTRGVALLTGQELNTQQGEAALSALAAHRRSLVNEAHEAEIRLEGLGVDPSDYAEQPANAAYSKGETARLEERRETLERDLAAANAELQSLKQSLCNETGDGIDRPWSEILGNLWTLREEKAAEYRQQTARILAQVGVTQVLERIAAEEDQRIRRGLQDPAVRQVLRDTTLRYRSVDLADGGLKVSSDTADYDLSELSTGAREQVLLALRMGFASRLAGGRPLFLILDDAFQHSDWERRERLVEQAVRMVQAGWQVTYLTMDDHLRDLFDRSAQAALGGDYRVHRIEA